ncbi:MAG: aldehyde dehydrogenase family protein [Saprospiraceae bacterium]
MNGGQTCIAPDYITIHRKIKDIFLEKLKLEICMYGENPEESSDYCRIINKRNFNRLNDMLGEGKIYFCRRN